MSRLGFAAAMAVAALVVAVVAVVAVDAWRAAGVHPRQCGSVLLAQARGDLRDDAELQTAAWSALVDGNADAVGDLGGSRPVLDRSCLIYAGRIGADPTAVFLETTVSGQTSFLRVAEVRPDGGGSAQRAVWGYPTPTGSELAAGVVLPLSGTYLAPPDVEAVTVIGPTGGAGTPARRLADGVYDLAPAPAGEVADPHVTLLLRRSDTSAPTAVAVSMVPQQTGPPVRVPMQLVVDGKPTADPPTMAAVTQVMPLLFADPRMEALVARAPIYPMLDVRTAVIPGGRGVVVASADPGGAGLPVFKYFVPDTGAAVVVPG